MFLEGKDLLSEKEKLILAITILDCKIDLIKTDPLEIWSKICLV